MRIDLCPCYILHSRPYRDTSALLECFSSQHGLVPLIAKGVKRNKGQFGLLQPFILLSLSWVGRGELKTLTKIEAQDFVARLTQRKILLGFYINELLIRLFNRLDPHPRLFNQYHEAISKLSACDNEFTQQMILRQFEIQLLAELGYGLNLTSDGKTGEPLSPDLLYSYDPQVGIYEIAHIPISSQGVAVSGASLLALAKGLFSTASELLEAKNIMRFILAHYLGNQPVQSRKLFQGAKT